MRILYKFILGFLLISLFVGLQAYIGYNGANSIEQKYNQVTEETLPVIENLNTIRFAGLNIIQATNEILRISPDYSDYMVEEINETLKYSEIYESSFKIYENKINTYFPEEKEHLEID